MMNGVREKAEKIKSATLWCSSPLDGVQFSRLHHISRYIPQKMAQRNWYDFSSRACWPQTKLKTRFLAHLWGVILFVKGHEKLGQKLLCFLSYHFVIGHLWSWPYGISTVSFVTLDYILHGNLLQCSLTTNWTHHPIAITKQFCTNIKCIYSKLSGGSSRAATDPTIIILIMM